MLLSVLIILTISFFAYLFLIVFLLEGSSIVKKLIKYSRNNILESVSKMILIFIIAFCAETIAVALGIGITSFVIMITSLSVCFWILDIDNIKGSEQ